MATYTQLLLAQVELNQVAECAIKAIRQSDMVALNHIESICNAAEAAPEETQFDFIKSATQTLTQQYLH